MNTSDPIARADALNVRGRVLEDAGQPSEAMAAYNQALELAPGHVESLLNRAFLLFMRSQADAALADLDAVLSVEPSHVEALNNRGNVLNFMNRREGALESYQRAIAAEPGHPQAHYNSALVLRSLGRTGEALESSIRALTLSPDSPDMLDNQAGLLMALGRYEDAVSAYARIIQLAPDFPYALGSLNAALRYCCDWSQYEPLGEAVLESVKAGQLVILPFDLLSVSPSGAGQFQCARNFISRQHPVQTPPLWGGEAHGRDRIRLAYVAAEFSPSLLAMVESHDATRFEVMCISIGDGAAPGVIQAAHMDDLAIATLLRDKEIDIAVDLCGLAPSGRPGIFAHRPAPIQVNLPGYPGTMGTRYHDYVIADERVIPHGFERFYSEAVARLPDSCVLGQRPGQPTAGPAPTGGSAGAFVFCVPDDLYKITPTLFSIWMRLLSQVEGSVLWLKESSSATAMENLRNEARQRGVEPERLVFSAEQHPALADLCLDTLPSNVAAAGALGAGTPIVTCTAEAYASRLGASLLHAVGLPELATDSLADYEALALGLARDPAALARIKARLAQNLETSSLFKAPALASRLQDAYASMHERRKAGLAPETFDVPRRV